MTDDERQELFTLMQQWGRKPDILYQKVREWIEDKKIPECSPSATRTRGIRRWRLRRIAPDLCDGPDTWDWHAKDYARAIRALLHEIGKRRKR